MTEFAYPLKWKYRDPARKGKGRYGAYKNRTGNSHGPRRHSVLFFLNQQIKSRGRAKAA